VIYLQGEDLGDNVIRELLHLAIEVLKGLLLLGLELGDPGGELSINLGLGGSERGSGLGLSLGLGVGDGLLGISAGGADDGLGLGGNLSDLARVALHVGELAADHTVAVIEGLAHGGEPELVKEHHEEDELGGHDGGGEVEVENLASVSGGGHGHEHVGERDGSTVAGSGGDLHLADGGLGSGDGAHSGGARHGELHRAGGHGGGLQGLALEGGAGGDLQFVIISFCSIISFIISIITILLTPFI